MSSLTAAIDQEMKEHRDARKNSGGRRAESPLPGGRHQSPTPRHLNVDDGRVRSTSRNSTGIPFAMPKSAPTSPRGSRMSDAMPYNSIASVSGGPKPRAMSSVYGTSSGFLGSGGPRDRHNSMSGSYNRSKSGSPGPHRSTSPRTRGPALSTSEAMRKMSESAMTDSDGEYTAPPRRKASDPSKGTTSAPGGGVRLTTDDDGDEGEDSAAVESSDNDSGASSDWDDGWAAGSKDKTRGRRRSRTESGGTDRMGREIVTAQSLFKTAKEEGSLLTYTAP